MELYTIPLRGQEGAGKFIIYRPLLGLAFVGNQAMANLVRRLAEDGAAPQVDAAALDFLSRIGFCEADLPHPAPLGASYGPTTAVLLLTNQCQLRCTYCYAAAGSAARQTLSFELGQAVIDQVCANAQKLGRPKFTLNFHGGGEPTLAWKTLQACTEYARRQPLPATINLTSNGIWSASQADWALDHIDSLSLSMDGSPQTQNRHRPYASGKGSSGKVMQTIAALDRRKFDYGIRMTAVAPWEDFPRDVRYLCEETRCPSMQVEPAFNLQRGGHRPASIAEALSFADAFLEALDIAKQAGRHLTYSGARLGQVTTAFCTAPYEALVVNPAGELVACYEVAGDSHPLAGLSVLGRVAAGQVEMDEAARNKLHTKMAERRAQCRDCFCYWSCAGDCYARSFIPGENGHLQHGARCEQNRYLLENLLLEAIAHGNGVWAAPRRRAVQGQAHNGAA